MGQTYYAACQWAILTILARLGNAEMVGQFALAAAITGPVVLFSNLKLRSIQATDAKGEFNFSDYLGLRLLTGPAAFCVIVLIAWLGDFSRAASLTMVVMGFAKIFESISDILYGYQQRHEQMDRIAKAMMIKGTLSIALFGLGFAITDSVSWGVAGLSVAWIVTLLLIDMPAIRRTRRDLISARGLNGTSSRSDMLLRPRWEHHHLTQLLLISLPLGITVTLGSLNTNVPRYFVEHVLDERSLGVFAAISYPLIAGSTVIRALAQSASPRLANNFASGDFHAFRHLLLRMIAMAFALGLAGMAFVALLGNHLLTILYGQEYAHHNDIFLLVMVDAAIGYMYVFLGTALSAMRRFKVQLPIHLVSVFVLIASSWMLISPYGLRGAVFAMAISGVVEAGLYGFVVFRQFRQSLSGAQQPR